ncbi:4-hydroxy-tetrahydrodipicolinate synthase [hydrothermal vent metagenome]|uniref:4-hydroxy-tetrahydrodipicolinate synthase n=1 Tax=hydrothermal vent metagenome TaxID=652676 RepID=A0A3B0ZJX4_9ZZZZ
MFQGSMCALVTPMHEDGSLDYPALDQLIEFHISSGTDAIVAVGTTGESATLDEKEHCDLIRHFVQKVSGRVPVIAGTGANSTTEAISLTRCAAESGADACLLVTPYYNKPTQEGLYLHHKAIADAVAIPQILYNVPGRTACDMLPETVARLSTIDNIIGIKEATGDLGRLHKIREMCGDDFDLYSGDDETALDFILAGGQGTISVTANVAPAAMSEMCKAALAGNVDKAKAINATLDILHRDLFVEANPIPVKWAMAEMGYIKIGIRLPMTWLSIAGQKKLGAAMQQAGVLKS